MGRFCNTTQPAVFSSLCSPTPACSPCPALCFLPSFTMLLFYFCFPCPLPSCSPHTPCPLFPCSLCPLPWYPIHLCFGHSGGLPRPPVLCFNVGPMGTGVHSKTGRCCEQEAESGAWGEQPAVTSAPRLPHLDLSIPRALCLSHCSTPSPTPVSSISALQWSSRPERQQEYPGLDTGERVQGLEWGHLDSDPSLATVCGLRGASPTELSVLSKLELVLFTLSPGAALRTKEVVRGLNMEISAERLTMHRFKVKGSVIAERIGNVVTATISSTLNKIT